MKYFFALVITFSASFARNKSAKFFYVVWNVGQGQFVSTLSPQNCLHFDMGGEFFPWQKILQECQDKSNVAFLSHWDWDHIGALNKIKSRHLLPDFCIELYPLGASTKQKMKLLNFFSHCDLPRFKYPVNLWRPKNIDRLDSNSRSQIVSTKTLLVPGDSPISQENQWLHQPAFKTARILILGHHGSNTSTSSALLKALPNLRVAISSARWRRYRHPHPAVIARLSQAKIPLLRTEDWGNIWIETEPLYY